MIFKNILPNMFKVKKKKKKTEVGKLVGIII
jgi:hypothetical protein